jgi:hypothetical protein
MVGVYQSKLEESACQLIAAITDTIDHELCRRQQELFHTLDLELQCLRNAEQTSGGNEQEENSAITFNTLLRALEDELGIIDRELCELTKLQVYFIEFPTHEIAPL